MENFFDYIIISVSNKKQKDILEKILKERLEKKKIANETKYIIIIEQIKVGSGGAIINVLKNFSKKDLISKKILLINSAGDSKRMLMYADIGKVCIPIYENNFNEILLDNIIKETNKLVKEMNPGMLITSGDCIIKINDFKNHKLKNNTVISIKKNIKIGENHGVFLIENGKLRESLQKNSQEFLKLKGAINKDNTVNIDTGIIYLNSEVLINLKKCNFNLEKNNVKLNLYTDFINAMSINVKFEQYMNQDSEAQANLEIISARKAIWNTLNKYTLNVVEIDNGDFIHLGTTQDFLTYAFEKNKKENVIYNSNINSFSKIGKNNFIENSNIKDSVIENNTVIMNSLIVNKKIPADLFIKTIKLEEEKYVTIILGINDNIKIDKVKIFGVEISNSNSLWNYKLFSVKDNKIDSVNETLEVYKNIKNNKFKFDEKRLSLKEIFEYNKKNHFVLCKKWY